MYSFPVKVAAALILIPLALLLMSDEYQVHVFTVGGIYLIATIGLNLSISAGLLSIGTAAFLMAGAYTVGLTKLHWDLNPVLGLILAALMCGAIGLITALPAMRLGAFAVAIVTLMYATVGTDLVLHFESVTGGGNGLIVGGIGWSAHGFWYLIAGVALVFFIGSRNLIHSPMGRALMMGRRSEALAASLGISTSRYKIASFTLYAAVSGVAGGLYQMVNGPMSIETFTIETSILILSMVILGGEHSVVGPILGCFALTVLDLGLEEVVTDGGTIRTLTYGAILVAVVLLAPGGLASVGRTLVMALRRREGAEFAESAAVDRLAFQEVLGDRRDPVGLELRAVSKSIGGLQILSDVSITVEPATIHGLIGPNGAGKTTLLNCMSGLTSADRGEIFIGEEVLTGDASRHAKAGVGRTFQTALLSDTDSVADNLLAGIDTHRRATYIGYLVRSPRARSEVRAAQEELTRWSAAIGLAAVEGPASGLTPRERRLVEIARALATRPRVILLDEPAAGLVGSELDELEQIIGLIRDAGITVVLVEHHAALVMRVCDTVTVLDAGHVLITDDPSVVSVNPEVVAAYLGDELVDVDGRSAP